MPKVIRTDARSDPAYFNFDDVTAQAAQCVAQARMEAAAVLAEADRASTAIRDAAEAEGRRAAEKEMEQLVEQRVQERLTGLTSVLAKCYDEIGCAREQWLAEWETRTIELGVAMARRIVRRELSAQQDIPLRLVREALELASGCRRLRVLMNPNDLCTLQGRAQKILDAYATVAATELVADETISPGGCRVETEHGAIDQQFEAQLARIAEELA